MSRGFGAMQRDILTAVRQVADQQDPDWYCPSRLLMREVKRMRQERYGPDYRWPLCGFEVSFRRALRGLIRRGILVHVDDRGKDTVWKGRKVAWVRRP